jgi:hypothetical protein
MTTTYMYTVGWASPRDTFYPHKMALTWSTSGGRSVFIVCSRTLATEFSFLGWASAYVGKQKKCPGPAEFVGANLLKNVYLDLKDMESSHVIIGRRAVRITSRSWAPLMEEFNLWTLTLSARPPLDQLAAHMGSITP